MTVHTTVRTTCDGPGCTSSSPKDGDTYNIPGWFDVRWDDGRARPAHFCSAACLARFALKRNTAGVEIYVVHEQTPTEGKVLAASLSQDEAERAMAKRMNASGTWRPCTCSAPRIAEWEWITGDVTLALEVWEGK